jgi:hypothetical protein
VTGRRGRRRRKLLDEPKERTGYSHLKEEALDRTMWRAGFGRGFGLVVRQTNKSNKYIYIYIYIYRGRDSSVGIGTRYGVVVSGIEVRSYTIDTGSFKG